MKPAVFAAYVATLTILPSTSGLMCHTCGAHVWASDPDSIEYDCADPYKPRENHVKECEKLGKKLTVNETWGCQKTTGNFEKWANVFRSCEPYSIFEPEEPSCQKYALEGVKWGGAKRCFCFTDGCNTGGRFGVGSGLPSFFALLAGYILYTNL